MPWPQKEALFLWDCCNSPLERLCENVTCIVPMEEFVRLIG